MKIQVFSTYQQNSSNPLMCFNKDHLVPLIPQLSEDDQISLYCVECGYKLNPGLDLYQEITKKVYYEQY